MPEYSEVCVWLQNDKHETMKKALAELNLKLVTLAEPKAGYLTYHMKDVSTAIYQAERAHGLPEKKVAERFYQRLAGKTVQFVPWTSCAPQASEGNI